uniref:Uncharacterized protein n=1 Tax=Globisporangium ultimum (strain ATCC 200006 / CBS 805.95 / DAOM BR144) TaxID=431595 RepID=K3WQL4_GLOUD
MYISVDPDAFVGEDEDEMDNKTAREEIVAKIRFTGDPASLMDYISVIPEPKERVKIVVDEPSSMTQGILLTEILLPHARNLRILTMHRQSYAAVENNVLTYDPEKKVILVAANNSRIAVRSQTALDVGALRLYALDNSQIHVAAPSIHARMDVSLRAEKGGLVHVNSGKSITTPDMLLRSLGNASTLENIQVVTEELDADALTCHSISHAGEIRIGPCADGKASCRSHLILIEGAGSVDVANVASTFVSIAGTGTGNVSIQVTEQLNLDLRAEQPGVIAYIGAPPKEIYAQNGMKYRGLLPIPSDVYAIRTRNLRQFNAQIAADIHSMIREDALWKVEKPPASTK